jgi:hypothetical protein
VALSQPDRQLFIFREEDKMAVRYESNPRPLSDWLTEVRQRRLALPRFQRMEAWGPSQVKELLQSLVDGLPVGAFLLLEVSGEPEFAYRTLKGPLPDSEGPIQEMLLDGQQRLTALWRALHDDYLKDDYAKDQFFLRVEADDSTDPEDLPIVERVRHYERDGKIYPKWTSNSKQVYERGLIPISILNPEHERKADQWIEEVAHDKFETFKTLNRKVADYRDALKHFEIPYIRLKAGTPPEAIIATFTKVNTQGTALSPFDLVVARMELHNIDLHTLSESLWENVPALKQFSRVDDLDILRALTLLDGKKPTRSNVLSLSPDHLKSRWIDLETGTRRALYFLQEEGIFDGDRIPTESILSALFALWAEVPEGGLEEGNARTLLRKYVWRAFFSDRYERAVNTAVLQDFRALRERLKGSQVDIPIMSAELPKSPEDLLEAGWPKRRDRLARAILCVTLRGQAKDIFDGRPISMTNMLAREYHHLFPKKYLRDKGIEEDQADRALNVALITWKTNRQISAASPRRYLEDAADKILADQELEDRLHSHLIPMKPFLREDFEGFLQERARIVFRGMEALVEGKDWRP